MIRRQQDFVLLEFTVTSECFTLPTAWTIENCQAITPESLDTDSQWKAWYSWARSSNPCLGLKFLLACDWLAYFYPELYNLIGCIQNGRRHQEGDAWQHTLHVVDKMFHICERDRIGGMSRMVRMLAALLHDVGKPLEVFSILEYDDYTKHQVVGVPIAEAFLTRIGTPDIVKAKVLSLVRWHCRHIPFFGRRVEAHHARKLVSDLVPATIGEWGSLVEADHSGRPPAEGGMPEPAKWFLRQAVKVRQRNAP